MTLEQVRNLNYREFVLTAVKTGHTFASVIDKADHQIRDLIQPKIKKPADQKSDQSGLNKNILSSAHITELIKTAEKLANKLNSSQKTTVLEIKQIYKKKNNLPAEKLEQLQLITLQMQIQVNIQKELASAIKPSS